jgi:hypothetical protein
MKLEMVEIDELVFDPNNARLHNEKNLRAIKGSLAKFGQQKPIVINHNNVVIAGNGTLQAAKELGWSKLSVVRTDLSGFEAAAFALADNRTAELATWDEEILGKTLQALREESFEIEEIGFEPIDMEWNADLDRMEDLDSEMTGLDEATIKIKCHKDDKDDVQRALKKAINDLNIAGVTIG